LEDKISPVVFKLLEIANHRFEIQFIKPIDSNYDRVTASEDTRQIIACKNKKAG